MNHRDRRQPITVGNGRGGQRVVEQHPLVIAGHHDGRGRRSHASVGDRPSAEQVEADRRLRKVVKGQRQLGPDRSNRRREGIDPVLRRDVAVVQQPVVDLQMHRPDPGGEPSGEVVDPQRVRFVQVDAGESDIPCRPDEILAESDDPVLCGTARHEDDRFEFRDRRTPSRRELCRFDDSAVNARHTRFETAEPGTDPCVGQGGRPDSGLVSFRRAGPVDMSCEGTGVVLRFDPIRVASVPAAHPYVQHLTDPDHLGAAVRLPDPAPKVRNPAPGQWWPPRMLDLDWLDEHHSEFDLIHLHFGFDAVLPAKLAEWATAARRYGLPLVLTVHDLSNPHFADPTLHEAQLDVLVPEATELITLTGVAARVIQRRWGRVATVVPHPHVVPLGRCRDPRTPGRPFVVGIHAKSLRANIDPVPLLDALAAALPSMPDVVLQLDVHPDVLDQDDHRARDLRQWMTRAAPQPQVRIEVHPRLDDGALWDYLESIDLCVLPYRFGTHSGWLEACVDLGTAVVVPATGCFHDQHGHPTYQHGSELVRLVRMLAADPTPARPQRPDRREQRRTIAVAHEEIYRRALEAERERAVARITPVEVSAS